MSVKGSSSSVAESLVTGVGTGLCAAAAFLVLGSSIPEIALAALGCALAPVALSQLSRRAPHLIPEMVTDLGEEADVLGKGVIESTLPPAAKTEPLLPAPRKQIISSETESLYLFKGTKRLKVKDESKLREQFVSIEKELRKAQFFLVQDEIELDKQAEALKKIQEKIKEATSDTGRADLEKQLGEIETKIKELEKRLKITLSVDFNAGTISYTNGNGAKIKAEFHQNDTVKKAVETLIQIHKEAVLESSEEETKQSLQNSQEIKDKGKSVTVLEVKLESNQYLLDVDGKQEWLPIPKDSIPTAYSELESRNQFYIEICRESQALRSIDLSIKKMKDSRLGQKIEKFVQSKESRWTYYMNSSQSTLSAKANIEKTEESLRSKILVGIKLDIEGTENPQYITKAGLKHYIAFLAALIEKNKDSPITKMGQLDEAAAVLGYEDLSEKGLQVGALKTDEILNQAIKELKQVDLEHVKQGLKGFEKEKEIKKKIVEMLQNTDEFTHVNPSQTFDKVTITKKINEITSLDGVDEALLASCKKELIEQLEEIDLKYILQKWMQRKSALERNGVEIKEKELQEYRKKMVERLEKSGKPLRDRLLDSGSNVLTLKTREETDLDLTKALSDSLFKSFVTLKGAPFLQQSKTPFHDLFKQIKGNERLSEDEIQILLDWFAALVNPKAQPGNPFSYASFSAFVTSLNTPFHTYSLPSIKQIGFGAAFDRNQTVPSA